MRRGPRTGVLRRPLFPSWAPALFLAWILAGCATHPVPLPPLTPAGEPQAWFSEMEGSPAPAPFKATVRIRIQPEGRRAVTINGSLAAALPARIKLNAQVGPFRPVFALLANPDSCELLIHSEKAYWLGSRRDVDWEHMSPAAWTQVLCWAFNPGSLFVAIDPQGPGAVRNGLWIVEGTLRGAFFPVHLEVDPKDRALERLRIGPPEQPRALCTLARYRRFGEAWLPSSVDLILPPERLRMTVELLRMQRAGAGEPGVEAMLRPKGWHQVSGLLPQPPEEAPGVPDGPPPGSPHEP
jgi:hypothetical protein